MSKKITRLSWLRGSLLVMALAVAVIANAAKLTDVIGYNWTTSGTNATLTKYTINTITVDGVSVKDSLFYTGDENNIVNIPETFEYQGITYTVVGVDANAFVNCRDIREIHLPATCVKFGNNCFRGCTNLTNFPVTETATTMGSGVIWECPNVTEAFVPSGVNGAQISNQFASTGVKKLTIMASTTPIRINKKAFGASTAEYPPLEELILYRTIDNPTAENYGDRPFHYFPSIQKVVIGEECDSIYSDFFIGCTGIQEVIFEENHKVFFIGSGAFQGCSSLPSIEVPACVTSVPQNLFLNCSGLQQVTFLGDLTSIQQSAFNGTTSLQNFNFPATLKTISATAFLNSGLTGNIVFPEGLTSIGTSAFAGANNITSISLPSTIATIGNAAFGPIENLASIELADGNSAFAVNNGILTNAAGTRLLVTAHEGEIGTAIDNATIETIDNYGMAFSPYIDVNLPALTEIGTYGFYRAAIKEFTYKGGMTVNANAFLESELETLNTEEGAREIPKNLCLNCTKLTTVNISNTVTNMFQDAFAGCTALKHMDLGANINYMEKGSVPATIESLTVRNVVPPVLGAGVFEPTQSNVVCTVAATSVNDYKAAPQWQYLDIQGDPSITGEGTVLGCPSGLYFATKDCRLMYRDNEGNIIDTEFNTGEHAFNIQSYKNRIYVASAGHNFMYQGADAQANGGDGELFYVNKTDDLWYRVTVLNNVGYKAFEDPFSMYISAIDNKIYIADRNVGIHEMSADTVGLYGTQPFFMENNWLPYYGDQLTYGAIGAGMTMRAIDVVSAEGTTRNNVYWVAKKFNGQGIFRFDKSMLYSDGSGSTHTDQQLPVYLYNVQMTSFYLDEENGYLYFFVQKDNVGGSIPGLYRISLATLEAKQNLATVAEDAVLIDNSPILLEGSGDEITGITQITGDGENIYWAYISCGEGTSVPNMVAYDATNPLHQTGIKMISAKPADASVVPPISYAVEGIAAYGVTTAKFEAPVVVIPGDVDGDGVVTANDVTVIYNFLLNGDTTYIDTSDVDGDGTVTAADVMFIYNILLGN
ncbi:MAG: leucine-rich repeat protein [Muribaculaceae bacterium]|nr:leucine-rich repeat protein [Muribaculaceae bacterium]